MSRGICELLGRMVYRGMRVRGGGVLNCWLTRERRYFSVLEVGAMAIPDYQMIMLPLLRYARDEREHTTREAVDHLATEFSLSTTDLKEMLPSGTTKLFDNRVGWASTYLRKAGLIESSRRGRFRITDRGRKIIEQNLTAIDVKFLDQFPEFLEFRRAKRNHEKKEVKKSSSPSEINPEEALESAFLELKENLASELLENIRKCAPGFFERIVVDVLLRMGYGGSRKEAGEAIGRAGDEGIDGIIKEDKLGLDIIYIQAKCWESTVGRPEIQKFAGALQGQRARKGIFITTSDFTKDALQYVNNIDTKIILIDGQRLAELMIEHNVGVSPVASYEIKKVDLDYFIED
jgi:restriction system protein